MVAPARTITTAGARQMPRVMGYSAALLGAGAITYAVATAASNAADAEDASSVDYKALEQDLRKLIASAGNYDDGR